MPNSKLSGLSLVAAFLDTFDFYVNDAGTSKRISGNQIRDALPRGLLSGGYAEVQANQGTYTATTDITGLAITVAPSSASRHILLFSLGFEQSSVAGDLLGWSIQEGATVIDTRQFAAPAANVAYVVWAMGIIVPTSAFHTYKVTGARNGGTGNITMAANANSHAFITAVDIGA